jgi:hypothetical protein
LFDERAIFIPLSKENIVTKMENQISKTERIKSGILGLLVGDALGVPYEFHAPENIPNFEHIEIEPPFGFERSHRDVPSGTFCRKSNFVRNIVLTSLKIYSGKRFSLVCAVFAQNITPPILTGAQAARLQ